MRGNRILAAGLIAITCVLTPANNSYADWQNPTGVCKDSRGCGSNTGNGGNSYSRSGSSPPWGGATADTMESAKKCRDFFCALGHIAISLPISLLMDAPYYAGKGVGYGLYYGGKGLGKGLYYGGRGLGQGLAYTGRAIGRGLAYPFNRPPKPILPPTTWEQYKHDVLKHQKRLAKANKANKENQRWCAKNVPLEISPNRARWEGLCNAGDAVSRASLPKEVIVASDVPVPAAPVVAAAIGADALPIAATPATAEQPPAASGATEVLPPPTAKPDDGSTSAELAPAAPAGAPIPAPGQPASGNATAPAQPPDTVQQQVVQTGVAPDKAGLIAAPVANPTPVLPAQGNSNRMLPSATPANVLTPSEYGFEGRGGYGARYDQIWGKETPLDALIAKWNFITPLQAAQGKVRGKLLEKGTELVSAKNLREYIKELALSFLERLRGSKGLISRMKDTQGARDNYRNYHKGLQDDFLNNLNNASAPGGDREAAIDGLNAELKRADDLQLESNKAWMSQVKDPLHLQELSIEQIKQKFSLYMPKYASIRQKTVCHVADNTLGIGCTQAKLIYSPPR